MSKKKTEKEIQLTGNEEITLTLSSMEVDKVMEGLGELKAKVSMPVLNKIQDQFYEQVTSNKEKKGD